MCSRNRVSCYPVFLLLIIFSYTCAETQGGDYGVTSDNQDDKLISQLLLDSAASGRGSNAGYDTEVARILKSLEEREQESSTPATTATIPKPTPTPTSTDSSPFFKTERPYTDRISKRSGYHHHAHAHRHFLPPFHSLLWNTGKAVWHVSRPVFYRTPVGRVVALAQDTVTLPIRTFGAVRNTIHNLYHHPHSTSIWNWGWGPSDDHHHHHHGHHNDVVYIKHEPDNSLFKSWLRYLYYGIRPAVVTKLWLKRNILRFKLAHLAKLAAAAARKKIHHWLHPEVVVVKDHHHHEPYHHHHHSPSPGWGWPAPTSPPPPPPPPPPTKATYGPPSYQPPPPVQADLTYGSASEWVNPYGDYQRKAFSTSKEPQVTPKVEEEAKMYADSPSPWLTAPGVVAPENILAQSSNANAKSEAFAKYVNQFVDTKSLTDTSPLLKEEEKEVPSSVDLLRMLRSNTESSGEVPYLVADARVGQNQEDEDEEVPKITWWSPRSGRTL